MSSDTRTPFERALASRLIAQPAPHVSPAVLEFRVQQLEAERAELIAALRGIVDDEKHVCEATDCPHAIARALLLTEVPVNDPTNFNPSGFGSIDFTTQDGQQEIARILNRLASERDALAGELAEARSLICKTWGEPANIPGRSLESIVCDACALLSRLDAGKDAPAKG